MWCHFKKRKQEVKETQILIKTETKVFLTGKKQTHDFIHNRAWK